MKNTTDKDYRNNIKNIFSEIQNTKKWEKDSLQKILRRYHKQDGSMFRKDQLVEEYKKLGEKNKTLEERIRMKPTRTNSGVATVTVLMKPYPCPGRCIYCPNDPKMPKSYISSEPGAQRALTNRFDPYAQVYNRLIALKNIGHNIEKVELIILGGTFSSYLEDYQLSFIHECYRALNDMSLDTRGYVEPRSRELKTVNWEDIKYQQKTNETAYCRNVGLVVETRPDCITRKEVIKIRELGGTKVQIGIQSLSDSILKKNQIGRNRKDTIRAFEILRGMGFKIHGHWMPNLYGATPKSDLKDYKQLWTKNFCPDELKIYPTSIIENTKLYSLYKSNIYKPYTDDQLKDLLKKVIPLTPRYCRLTRIVRDIPSNEIVAGNKKTNLRQIVEQELEEEEISLQDIRAREIKGEKIEKKDIELETIRYNTKTSKEFFISYKTKSSDKICGFLRLSLPKKKRNPYCKELDDCSIIREVHVYGKVLGIKDKSIGEPQHFGLGGSLIEEAERISKENNFSKISVISAIGTREYYRKRGFRDGELYMWKELI